VQISERRDARRLVVAVAAAILVHVGLFFGIPFLTSLDTAPLPDYGPIVVTLEEPRAALETPKPPPAPKPSPAPRPEPAASAAAAKPAASPSPAKPAASAPSATAAAPRRGPSFRQAGATTGTSAGAVDESIVSGPPPVTLPAARSTVPVSGEQRSGEAAQSGPTTAGSGGSLKSATAKLDTSLAGVSRAGTTGAAAASGGGTGTSAASSNIKWEDPSAAKGRKPTFEPETLWPAWVKDSGVLLEVRIQFSVNAYGLVTPLKRVQGSGYADVDDACMTAMRKYKFTAAIGAADIRGVALFYTKLKS